MGATTNGGLVKGATPPSQAIDKIKKPNAAYAVNNALYTLWLFTFSDLKTLIIPSALIGLANARSGRFLAPDSITGVIPWEIVLTRMPLAIFWLWLTTLLQGLANQRLGDSVKKAASNTPRRPLPSKRITEQATVNLLFYVIIISLGLSAYLGDLVFRACTALIAIVYLYNDLDGSNSKPFVRNALVGCRYIACGLGATAIATGTNELTEEAIQWFGMIWLTIFLTSHGQDLVDMEGDRARGRATMPLIFGEVLSRISLAVSAIGWTIVVPWFWNVDWIANTAVGLVVQSLMVASGMGMAVTVGSENSRRSNKLLVKLWCLWIATVFMAPIYCR